LKELLFSIVIPSYNRADHISAVIRSFLDQDYTAFELIIVDDGSNDNTKDVVSFFTDKRIHYYYKENGERGAARNFGARLAKGDYINFFDSDDIAYSYHLQTAAQIIGKLKNPEVFHTGYEVLTPQYKVKRKYNSFDGNVEKYCIRRKEVSINSIFLRKDITGIVPFSELRSLSASEDALWLCQLTARYTIHYENKITSAIIEHDQRSMWVASEKKVTERKKYLIEGLKNDFIFMKKYGHLLKYISSEMSYLLCFSSLRNKNKKKGLSYFIESVKGNPGVLFSRRTLFVGKCLLS
jgi:glycosyltransferase involved in cell wall biosynthesis